MRRVIYAWNYLEWGGAQIHFLALIKEVRKHFEVVVVLPAGSSAQLLGFLHDLDIRYEFSRYSIDLAPAPTLTQKIKKHFRKLRSEFSMLSHIGRLATPDSIVHVDLLPQQSLLALALLSLRSKVFTTAHNALPKVGRLRDTLWHIKFRVISLFRNYSAFCSNEDARKYFSGYYLSRVAQRIEVTYTSINPIEIDQVLASEFDRAALLGKLAIPSDRPTVLAVGQFVDRKGRWVLLEAAKKVLEKTDALFLWVTPQTPSDSDLARIKSFDLDRSFQIVLSDSVGTRRSEILNFFRVANVFALPSFVEGLPIALLEAMALGVPSVSTNVNGIPEAIKNRETGLLVEPGDPDALAIAIQHLLTDIASASKIAENGRKFAIEHFDERVAAQTVLNSYLKSR